MTNHVVDSFDDDDDNNIAFRNNINVATKKKENTADVLRASTTTRETRTITAAFNPNTSESVRKEKKNTEEEEDTDCYGKRAFPKRFFTSNRFVKPGLGLAWANCPNSSVFLTRDDNGTDGGETVLFVFAAAAERTRSARPSPRRDPARFASKRKVS